MLNIQANPALGDCNNERVRVDWSSRTSFSRMKHGLGLFLGDQSTTSGYNERVNSIYWPIRMSCSWMKHDWVRCRKESSPWVAMITRRSTTDWLTSISDLTRWGAPPYVSFSSLFFKKTKSRMMLYANWWQPVASWRTLDGCSGNKCWERGHQCGSESNNLW